MAFTFSEHITGLTVAGFYYWFIGDDLGAKTCWETGVAILPLMSTRDPRGTLLQ